MSDGDLQPGKPKFDLEERLLDYATRIIRLAESLPKTRAGNHVAGQLLRSGTSPLSNHAEAQAAESRPDFVHKMRICLKELRESRRWLLLCQRVPLVRRPSNLDPLIGETEELISIFVASIRTATKRMASAKSGSSISKTKNAEHPTSQPER